MKYANEAFYDVVIVGAGPAGILSANLLGKLGIQVLIIDKEADVMEIPRAVGLCNEGSRVLNAADILEDFNETLYPVDEIQFRCSDSKPFFRVDCASVVNGFPILRTIYQPDLERCMRRGIEKYSNVEFLKNTECLQIEDFGSDVRCRLVTKGADYRNIRCRYVLACDGGKSSIRKMMGVGFTGHTYAQDWLIVDVENDLDNPEQRPAGKECERDIVYFMCDPARPGVTLPTPDKSRRWEFVVKQGESDEQITSDLSVKELLKPWGNADDMNVLRKTIYTFHARVAKQFRKGNVFLLGDAAHLTPPFAGQGLMAGLRDAHNLCWKIASVVKGDLPDSFLDSYDSERRPQAAVIVNLARFLGLIILPQNSLLVSIRNLIFRIRHRFVSHGAISLMKKTPNSILGFRSAFYGLKDLSRITEGFEFSQFRVFPDGGELEVEPVLIDNLLQEEFTLVSYGEAVSDQLSEETLDLFKYFNGKTCVIKPSYLRGFENQGAQASDLVVFDESDQYRKFFDSGERVALVRPDRMVAVSTSKDKFNRALQKYLTAIGGEQIRQLQAVVG